jgi:hypothetical protein
MLVFVGVEGYRYCKYEGLYQVPAQAKCDLFISARMEGLIALFVPDNPTPGSRNLTE